MSASPDRQLLQSGEPQTPATPPSAVTSTASLQTSSGKSRYSRSFNKKWIIPSTPSEQGSSPKTLIADADAVADAPPPESPVTPSRPDPKQNLFSSELEMLECFPHYEYVAERERERERERMLHRSMPRSTIMSRVSKQYQQTSQSGPGFPYSSSPVGASSPPGSSRPSATSSMGEARHRLPSGINPSPPISLTMTPPFRRDTALAEPKINEEPSRSVSREAPPQQTAQGGPAAATWSGDGQVVAIGKKKEKRPNNTLRAKIDLKWRKLFK